MNREGSFGTRAIAHATALQHGLGIGASAAHYAHRRQWGAFAQLLAGCPLNTPASLQFQPSVGTQIAFQPAKWLQFNVQGTAGVTAQTAGANSVDYGGTRQHPAHAWKARAKNMANDDINPACGTRQRERYRQAIERQ